MQSEVAEKTVMGDSTKPDASVGASPRVMLAIEHNENLVVEVLKEKGGHYNEGKAYLHGQLLTKALDEEVDGATIDENDFWDKEEAEIFIENLELLASLGE